MAPWNRQQLRVLAALNAVGLVLLLIAWRGSDGTDALEDQVGWLNLGVLAVVLAAGTDVLWLSRGRSRLITRRRALLADVAPLEARTVAVAHSGSGWVAVPGTVRAHRPGCLLVAGKAVEPLTPDAVAASDRRSCEICSTNERAAS